MATQLNNLGAQMVYAPAAGGIMGAVQASSDSDRLFISCDIDTWNMMAETDPEIVRNVISSTMKNMGDAIFTVLTGLVDGTYVLGENHVIGVAEGAVGLADNDNFREHVPIDARQRLDEVTQLLADGHITVGTAFGMDAATLAALRESMAP
jgi:basic membrane protein A